MAEPRFVPSNPFSHSGPVTGEQFCDREEEQRRLLELLGTTPPTSIALYGPERIGKSSLLRQLCEVEGPQQLPNRRFVYLDLMRIRSPEAFLRRTLAALEDKAGQHYDDLEAAITDEKAPPLVLALVHLVQAVASGEGGWVAPAALPAVDEGTRQALVERGVLEEREGRYRFRVALLQRWVAQRQGG